MQLVKWYQLRLFLEEPAKAIIAREIDRDPDLLIVSQPTRGLDVGAIEYIHKRLIQERDNGKAVLVVSFELDEILNVSDRIAVIHDGKIQGIVTLKQRISKNLESSWQEDK